MRVLLVNAIDQSRGIESLFPPLGLGYLAAWLRERVEGVEVRVVDDGVEHEIDAFRPNVVGISAVSQNYGTAQRHARLAKTRGLPVVVGGVHISMLPASLSSEMDVGVIGEGEETLVELLGALAGGSFDRERLSAIPGVVYRDGDGELALTPPREPFEPLDRLPLPARDLLAVPHGGTCHLFSSRGCPYRCVFCASSRLWPRARALSAEYVVREIGTLAKRYAPRQIVFYDDLFVLDRRRLRSIVELVEAERIGERVEFAVSVRANLVDEEVADLLKRMNVTAVSMGLESGCETTLAFLKPHVTVEDNRRAVSLLDRMGFAVNASFVIGSPDESRAEIEETLRFIENAPLNLAETYILTAYPGTPVWDYALERGLVFDDMDWGRLALGVEDASSFVHLSRRLTREELFGLYRAAQRLAKWKRRSSLARQAWRNPRRVVPFLVRRIASMRS